jgi:hypothetical protein
MSNRNKSSNKEIDYYSPKREHEVTDDDFMPLYGMEQEELEELPGYIQDILNYSQNLVNDGKCIGINEAIYAINRDSLSWVKIGSIAYTVKRFRRYIGRFKSFKDFCENGLKRTHFYINRLIKAAKTVIELAKMGFTQLPTNESQARPLTKYEGDELKDKWQQVLSTVPGHLINGRTIEETIEPKDENAYQAIKITGTAWDNFRKKALESGLDPNEELEKLLDIWNPKEEPKEVEELDDEEIEPITPEQVNRWLDDVEALCASYDLQQLQTFYSTG